MGLHDRHYYRDHGGGSKFGSYFRRVFGSGENPLEWAVPIYRAWGITVKLHVLFILMVIGKLFLASSPSGMGAGYVALAMGTLFFIVLLHEYGHCIAARRVGGSANEILLWPLGGLAMCQPPHHWRAHLITAIGGPLVNVLLMPVFGVALGLAGFTWYQIAGFNPFDPGRVIATIQTGGSGGTWARNFLWWAHYLNILLLGFNVLVPMFPMDGGRIAQAILWRSMGYRRSMLVATTLGMFIAGAMFIFSSVGGDTQLQALAIFGGLTSFIERQRAKMTGDQEYEPRWIDHEAIAREQEAERQERHRQLQEEAGEQEELDRLLAKIKQSGMGSLSKREKAWLERQSQARRER